MHTTSIVRPPLISSSAYRPSGSTRHSPSIPLRASWAVQPRGGEDAACIEFLRRDVQRRFELVDFPYGLWTLSKHAGAGQKEYVAHVLNYLKTPQKNVRLRCPGAARW